MPLSGEPPVFESLAADRGGTSQAFRALLASPRVAASVDALYTLRWTETLQPQVLHAVLLVAARQLKCDGLWSQHRAHAIAAGIPVESIRAIGAGLSPPEPATVRIACQIAKRLLLGRRVGSYLWSQGVEALGERGLADLAALLGTAGIVAMAANLQDH